MKIIKIFAAATFALVLNACEMDQMDQELINNPFDEAAISLENIPLHKSFIIISKSNTLPDGFDEVIASANGTLVNAIPGIGIARVDSEDPDFMAKVTNITGISAVVPNLKSQYIDPNMRSQEFLPAEEETEKSNKGKPRKKSASISDFYFALQWGPDAIDAPEAWEAGYRGDGVKVGVLDTGFDLDHPDLAPNISDLSYDFTGEGLQYSLGDVFSHGTHTAGIIAAAENGFGTIGIAPEAELVLIKVLYDEGYGYLFDILNGIIYAALVDVDVINMSIGSTFEKSGNAEDGYSAADAAWYKNIYERAIAFAYQNGTTVIASAGNEAIDYDHSADLMHMPSGAAHALSISSTAPIGWAANPLTNLDMFASTYSNYGQSTIDFAAPGGNYAYAFTPGGYDLCTVGGVTHYCYVFDFVFSTGNGGWYWSVGTSMAAPHAAGVAALIVEKNGGSMAPGDVKEALLDSSDDLGKPGNDDFYGMGRVNALKAVSN
ncbi:MAG: S8 family serine peptidase [Bacteroidota bacterium]